ncbi:MAG: potassium channel family protein [Turicibacter sp.]
MREILYEIIMMGLAIVVVIIAMIQLTMNLDPNINQLLNVIDLLVWIVFVLDYSIRLIRSENKRHFITHNKLDLITILPFNSLFRMFRILKVAKVLKLLKIVKATVFLSTFTKKLNKFITTNNFHIVLIAVIILIFLGSGLIYYVEDMTFSDAIWWSLVTTTTVGYGDISPETGMGRIIASILMLTGIGFLGMLTGTISTFFLSPKSNKTTYHQQIIEDIKVKLDNFDELSENDLNQIHSTLLNIKTYRSNQNM